VSTTRRIEARPADEDNDCMDLAADKIDEPVYPTNHAAPRTVLLCRCLFPAFSLGRRSSEIG
jgi:hypothetical protein